MKKIILCFTALTIVLVSCNKEKPLNADITKTKNDTYVKGEDDDWLEANFLNPYNIEVLYRFDRFQASIDKEISPVEAVRVKPIMQGVEAIFIKPYLEITNKAFLLPILPKVIALFGTGEYSDNQITLGTADAGRQINLYEVNKYDRTVRSSVLGTLSRPAAFHTMHHEFGHILNQNIPVPPAYEEISSNYIGSAWVGAGNSEAVSKSLGFITRYARNNKDEDFAEMIATLLVEGQDVFDAFVYTADASAQAKLRRKEQMVVDYYKSAFGIDFRALQARVKQAMETYAPVTITPAFTNYSGGVYNTYLIDRNAASQSTNYITAFNATRTALLTRNVTLSNTVELSFANRTVNRTSMILKFRTATAVEFWFDLTATMNTAQGTVRYALSPVQGTSTPYVNSGVLAVELKPLLDYFTTKTFGVNWVENIFPNSRYERMGFFDTANSNNLGFHATLVRN